MLSIQESITSIKLLDMIRERILVFHMALASLALFSCNVNEKIFPFTSTLSSLMRLEAIDLELGESTTRRTDHKWLTPLLPVHQRSLLARTQ